MTVTDDFEVESITISINVGIIYQGYHGSVVIKNKVTPDNGSRTIKHK